MRVVLFHNDEAGGSTTAPDLRRAIERHGHQVVHVVDASDGVERLLDYPADLIVAAGGDGTAASVARVVAGQALPLAVLPLGTANNIAVSFGCDAPLDVLIDHWSRATVRHADLGLARGSWGERRFIEGVGGGLVTRSIAAIDAQPLDPTHPPDSRIELAIGGYLNVLARLTAERWSLRLDGTPLEGEFLLVEILNIKSIGPNFLVSDRPDPFDGAFTLVLATETDREDLVGYWQARMAGDVATLHLPVRNAASVTIDAGGDLHLDDALFAFPESGGVELQIEPGLLKVLEGPAYRRPPATSDCAA